MKEHLLFLTGISFLMVHEMDAIRCKEWRIYPGLSLLSNKAGQLIFVFAHIPLFFLVMYQIAYNTNNQAFIKGVNIFLMVHAVLHLFYIKHKNNEFKDGISWTLIITPGLFGLADLLSFFTSTN
jgi:hypothetical protein